MKDLCEEEKITDELAARIYAKALGFVFKSYKQGYANIGQPDSPNGEPAIVVVLDSLRYMIGLEGSQVKIRVLDRDVDLDDGTFVWMERD